ncbi:MAG: sugar-binding protein [Fusobacteriaceae bacterium]|jgi:putative multiple sugar transport system substrate-binding protein|nr:sugar-binding protein [Fusobacteriaceae bacterium]
MKKLLSIVAMLILASLSLFAKATIVGIAMPETHVLRWTKDGESLKKEAEKRGYSGLVQYGNADQAQQNQQIQSFLTQGAKVLIIGNINDGVKSVVEEAARDKAVVVAYDRIIQGTTNYSAFITFNNYKVGTLQGQGIEKALNLPAATTAAPKYITLFAGSPTDANANFFYQGAIDVLNPYIKKGVLKVVGPYPETYKDTSNFQKIATENWSGPLAKTRMENLLNNDASKITLDAVLSPNDTLGRAIIEACKADAKYRSKLPVVTGQDAEFDSAVSIKNGEQYMTVFKDTAKLAEAAVILADALAKGEKPNIPGAVLAEGDLKEIGYTGTGYVATYLLDPIGITKENVNVPVDAGFYTAEEAAKLK